MVSSLLVVNEHTLLYNWGVKSSAKTCRLAVCATKWRVAGAEVTYDQDS